MLPTAQLASALFLLLLLFPLLLRLRLARQRRALAQSNGCLPAPAHPHRDPILGLDLLRDNLAYLRTHRFLEGSMLRSLQTGNTMWMNVVGRYFLTTVEPENLKTIQSLDFKKWGLGKRRTFSLRPLLGDGIFTTDGAAWAHSREMLRPNFTRSQVGDLPTFERHIQNLIHIIPRDRSTVDLSELFFRLTIDSATEFLFGESCASLTKTEPDGFALCFNRALDYCAHRTRWGPVYASLFPANKHFAADSKYIHAFADHFVRRALAKRNTLPQEKHDADQVSERYVFIEELARRTSDPVAIRSEALNILLAGRDTTASLLTNMWFMLARRPDIWRALQADIATLHGSIPTFTELKDLKYLQALMRESLRVHPVVPQNSREALVDTTLPRGGGPDGRSPVFIPRGTAVAWSLYTMHRRTDLYGPDADEFRPARWLDDPSTGKKGLRPGWEYLPFNGGPRICLGQQFALAEAGYTTVRLCQAFEGIEQRDFEPWIEGLLLTCASGNGAKVGLVPREM